MALVPRAPELFSKEGRPHESDLSKMASGTEHYLIAHMDGRAAVYDSLFFDPAVFAAKT